MEVLQKLIDTLPGSNDKSFIYKQLHKIRSSPNFQEFFSDNLESISVLVEILIHQPNEKILEVTLSLLGNCCSKEVCCEKVSANAIPVIEINYVLIKISFYADNIFRFSSCINLNPLIYKYTISPFPSLSPPRQLVSIPQVSTFYSFYKRKLCFRQSPSRFESTS